MEHVRVAVTVPQAAIMVKRRAPSKCAGNVHQVLEGAIFVQVHALPVRALAGIDVLNFPNPISFSTQEV